MDPRFHGDDEEGSKSGEKGHRVSKRGDAHVKQPCVYMLASRPRGTLYTGVTSDLCRRLSQHRRELAYGFTKRYGVKRLVWYEPHECMESAILREKRIKKWNRRWKIELIVATNPEWIDLFESVCGTDD